MTVSLFVVCNLLIMSKVIYKNDKFEVRSWDVVKLTNGIIVSIFGGVYEHIPKDQLPLGDDKPIYLLTTPTSYIASKCYPEHIVEIVEHCGCFENQIDYCYKHSIGQPLYVLLNRGQKE